MREWAVSRVCAEQCRHCLFGSDPVPGVGKAAAWLAQLYRAVGHRRVPAAGFLCHRFTDRNQEVVCRGWWDRRWRFGWRQCDEEQDAHLVTFVPLPPYSSADQTDWTVENVPHLRESFDFRIDESDSSGRTDETS